MKTSFTIGKILKPRGIKGVLKFETYTDNPSRFLNIKILSVGGVPYVVESMSREGTFCYVKLKGVDTVEAAELLRGKDVSADRAQLPKPADGRYYIVDMIGIDVYASGLVGELVDVLQYGSADVYVVKTKEGSVSFPALKELILSVDMEKGEMHLDDRIFDRVAVHNN
jgi:16S rRNA processing protein RimM